MYCYRIKQRRQPLLGGSHILSSVLYKIYRKNGRCPYEDIGERLVDIGFLAKVDNNYISTEKSKEFKAVDFAKEFLWEYWNKPNRKLIDSQRFIYCYSDKLPNGRGLVSIDEALAMKIV